LTAPFGRRRFLALSGAASLALLDACSSSSGHPTATAPVRFSDDFHRPPGPLGNGWRDAHTALPLYEDRLGIVSGGVADVALEGSRDQDPASSGWRGAFYREMSPSPGVRVVTEVYLHPEQATSGGGPLVHCVPAATAFGLGAWYDVGFGLDWFEFGIVGRRSTDFQFLDTFWAPKPGSTFELEIRSVDGMAAVWADGRRVCGPLPVPASLRASSSHGGQIDIGSRREQSVAQIRSITIEPYTGGPIPEYEPAQLSAAPAAFAPDGALSLPRPVDSAPGDLLIALLSVADDGRPAAPPGWTAHGFAAPRGGPGLGCWSRRSDGHDPPATFPVGSRGGTGVVIRARGANPTVGFTPALQRTTSSAEVTAPSQLVFGPHRAGLWAAAAPAGAGLHLPTSWSPLVTAMHGAPVTLVVGSVPDWAHGPTPVVAPYGGHGKSTGELTGHLDQLGPSVALSASIAPLPPPLS
jgi:hypothetical protein